MKTAVWLCFAAVLLASVTAAICLWVGPDFLNRCLGGRPLPLLTLWAFSSAPWLPLTSLPWLAAALWISLQKAALVHSVLLYAASALLACVGYFSFAIVPCVFPLKEFIVGM